MTSAMPKVRPKANGSVMWMLRRETLMTWVQAHADEINITINGWQHTVSRKDARLLAKRINQCLDETRHA